MFAAFDVLWLDGRDLRSLPLVERKRLLSRIVPPQPSRVLYVDHVVGHGAELFNLACERDLEGIVAKWGEGRYLNDGSTSWLKIKNPHYSQMEGRRELFERRREARRRQRKRPRPRLQLS